MASAQEILSAVNSMQANAQAALPVMPNNGNPGGAHNMPQQNGAAPAAPTGPDLSWLKASPAMEQLRASSAQRQKFLDGRLASIRQQPQLPVVDEPTPLVPQQAQLPVLPQANPQMMPANPNIVLPMAGAPTWNGM